MAEPRRGVEPPVIDAALATELLNYKGRWVAIDEGHVVASGDTLTEAMDAAQARGVPDPLMYRVSVHPGSLRIYRDSGAQLWEGAPQHIASAPYSRGAMLAPGGRSRTLRVPRVAVVP